MKLTPLQSAKRRPGGESEDEVNWGLAREVDLVGYRLIGTEEAGSLNGHIFETRAMADAWMAQPYTRDCYGLDRVSFKRRKCCGEPYQVKTMEVLIQRPEKARPG